MTVALSNEEVVAILCEDFVRDAIILGQPITPGFVKLVIDATAQKLWAKYRTNIMSDTYLYHIDGSQPQADEIFVFGSNLAGIHGAGAARAAYGLYGAKWGHGVGLTGTCYALPTKDENIESLALADIKKNVDVFLTAARAFETGKFFITRIGCGLAGFTDDQIAPMFAGAPTNCNFPTEWKQYLELPVLVETASKMEFS